jgi:hypothetical protein
VTRDHHDDLAAQSTVDLPVAAEEAYAAISDPSTWEEWRRRVAGCEPTAHDGSNDWVLETYAGRCFTVRSRHGDPPRRIEFEVVPIVVGPDGAMRFDHADSGVCSIRIEPSAEGCRVEVCDLPANEAQDSLSGGGTALFPADLQRDLVEWAREKAGTARGSQESDRGGDDATTLQVAASSGTGDGGADEGILAAIRRFFRELHAASDGSGGSQLGDGGGGCWGGDGGGDGGGGDD